MSKKSIGRTGKKVTSTLPLETIQNKALCISFGFKDGSSLIKQQIKPVLQEIYCHFMENYMHENDLYRLLKKLEAFSVNSSC